MTRTIKWPDSNPPVRFNQIRSTLGERIMHMLPSDNGWLKREPEKIFKNENCDKPSTNLSAVSGTTYLTTY